jgi:hypothetical protein
MPTVADYIVVREQAVSFNGFNDPAMPPKMFPLSSLPTNVATTSPAILTFNIELHGAKNVNLQVGIGPAPDQFPQNHFAWNWTTTYLLTTMQVIWNSPLNKTQWLHLKRGSVPGSSANVFDVANIVLWFQANV